MSTNEQCMINPLHFSIKCYNCKSDNMTQLDKCKVIHDNISCQRYTYQCLKCHHITMNYIEDLP